MDGPDEPGHDEWGWFKAGKLRAPHLATRRPCARLPL